jgi:hypothetical protein
VRSQKCDFIEDDLSASMLYRREKGVSGGGMNKNDTY